MRKAISLSIALFATSFCLHAQTKVFKEVSDDISSQVRAIKQDDALVGYVVFTRLEKASADSFNYKVSILDENLNDIGKVNFKDESLTLKDISLEQDVLCLAYLKSNVIGNSFTSKEYKRIKDNSRNFVMLQFIGLDGKIIKTNSTKVNITVSPLWEGFSTLTVLGDLKYPIQINNIPNKGFACFFGDENNTSLSLYGTTGEQRWQKKPGAIGAFAVMRTTGNDIYLLGKEDQKTAGSGGFQLLGYGVADGASYDKFALRDKQGNELKVISFENDPSTGKPYLSGYIINPKKSDAGFTGRQLSRGPYSGLFTININGTKKADLNQVYSYWGDGSQEASISKKGRFADINSYALITQSFKDYQGDTYFVGSALIKKTRWGAIASSVVLAPLLVPPIWILGAAGTTKCKFTDVVLLKQNAKGAILFENAVAADNSSYNKAEVPMVVYNKRSFHHVVNSTTKTNYVVVDDVKNIVIYNVNDKKVQRTIPHKDGQTKIEVYPAKEGHIMVSEYNKKEKYTQFSIEAL